MEKNSNIKKIIGLFVSILLIGLFLVAIVSTNKFIQTVKSIEYKSISIYAPATYYFKQFSEVELDQETSQLVVDTVDELIEEINDTVTTRIDYAIVDSRAGILFVSDDTDPILAELVYSLDSDSRKLAGNYDYFNSEFGVYRFLLKIDYGGVMGVLSKNDLAKTLITNAVIFVGLSIALFACFCVVKKNKTRKLVGLIFIVAWIGSISAFSAVDLSNQYRDILENNKNHLTSLISYYYRQDIIEYGDDIGDYREWAEDVIMQFSDGNEYISNIELNDNYDISNLDISHCLTFTYNENSIKNKNIEFGISAILFLILAFIIYDQLVKSIFPDDDAKSYEALRPLDRKIAAIELINLSGNFLTSSIVLPQLMMVAKNTFVDGGAGKVAMAYSLGLVFNAVFTVLSAAVMRKLKTIKRYYCAAFTVGLVGLVSFTLSDNFWLVTCANCLLNIKTGLSNLQSSFYISPCKDENRHEQFRIYSQNTQKIGQSIGIIVGGVLGSVFEYRYVFFAAVIIAGISVVQIFLTDSEQYLKFDKTNQQGFGLSYLLNMRFSLLYCLCIVFSKSFYDVYVDYKLPIDIINLGLTTVVISFVSMLSRLISAYSGKIVFMTLKKKFDDSNMTFLFIFGTAATMLIYSLNGSIIMIGITTVLLGIFDGFGGICYKQAFVEVAAPEGVPENDANVILKMTSKLGGSIGPSIIELLGNVIYLPVYMLASLSIYILAYKKRKH